MASNSEVTQEPEPSYEACHRVLETVELLEMILLSLHGPQDVFRGADIQYGNIARFSTKRWGDIPGTTMWDRIMEYKHIQHEARCNMRTLLLSQRVNHVFKDTIQGSTKLRQALWFAQLKDSPGEVASENSDGIPRINPLFSKRFATPVYVEGFSWVSPLTGPRTLHVKFERNADIVSAGRPGSWSRMLIAQSADPTVIPMEVHLPISDYSYAFCGPVRKVFEASETAGHVLRHAEESEHRVHLETC